MTDAPELLRLADRLFREALRLHTEGSPRQAEAWQAALTHGPTQALVIVEVSPAPAVAAAFRLEDGRELVFCRRSVVDPD